MRYPNNVSLMRISVGGWTGAVLASPSVVPENLGVHVGCALEIKLSILLPTKLSIIKSILSILSIL